MTHLQTVVHSHENERNICRYKRVPTVVVVQTVGYDVCQRWLAKQVGVATWGRQTIQRPWLKYKIPAWQAKEYKCRSIQFHWIELEPWCSLEPKIGIQLRYERE